MLGEKYHPVPRSILTYHKAKDGYVVPLSKDGLKPAAAYDLDELIEHDGDVREKSYSYYKVTPTWHSSFVAGGPLIPGSDPWPVERPRSSLPSSG